MKKRKLTQRILEYTAIFEPAEEGGYVASVPAVPGCHTEGDTLREAKANIAEALSLCLEVLEDEGQKIPQEERKVVVSKVSVPRPVLTL